MLSMLKSSIQNCGSFKSVSLQLLLCFIMLIISNQAVFNCGNRPSSSEQLQSYIYVQAISRITPAIYRSFQVTVLMIFIPSFLNIRIERRLSFPPVDNGASIVYLPVCNYIFKSSTTYLIFLNRRSIARKKKVFSKFATDLVQ